MSAGRRRVDSGDIVGAMDTVVIEARGSRRRRRCNRCRLLAEESELPR